MTTTHWKLVFACFSTWTWWNISRSTTRCSAGGCWVSRKITATSRITTGDMLSTLLKWCSRFWQRLSGGRFSVSLSALRSWLAVCVTVSFAFDWKLLAIIWRWILFADLDHRGTNNSFQIKWVWVRNDFWILFKFNFVPRASSPLAQLYSTSTMEHHHFDQCLMILNSPGNQILSNLSSEDYSRVIRVLEDAILSTDLAVYFRWVIGAWQ